MQIRGSAGGGIHVQRLEYRRAVREIPGLLENDVGAGRAELGIVILIAAVFKTKAQGVLPNQLGKHVADGKRSLREKSRRGVTLRRAVDDALPGGKSALYFSSRNRPVDLGIGSDVVVGPARKVEARFVDRRGVDVEYPAQKSRGREAIRIVVSHRTALRAGIRRDLMVLGKKRVHREHAASHVEIHAAGVLIAAGARVQNNLREFEFWDAG